MGNLFLGFPVARAKIADMISTSAPPALHHTQHENGGSDEIDATGLTGAGGGGFFPLQHEIFTTTLENAAAHTTAVSGSGAAGTDTDGTYLDTGLTINSEAEIYKAVPRSFLSTLWNRQRQFTVSFREFGTNDNTGMTAWFVAGYRGSSKHIGFYTNGLTLYSSSYDGTTLAQTALQTVTKWYNTYRTLSAIFYPGVKIEYWVDGILLLTQTTNLPAGTTSFDAPFTVYVLNESGGSRRKLRVQNITSILKLAA